MKRLLVPLLALLALAQSQPAPKLNITIARDTTRLTTVTPRPDGSVNYIAAYDALISTGITQENNAYRHLLQIVGTNTVSEKIRPALLAKLNLKDGGDAPDTDRFQSLADFMKGASTTPGTLQRLDADRDTATSTPWTDKDHPELAAWLRKNNPALDAALKASSATRFYIPPIPDQDEWFSGVLLPSLPQIRELLRGLALRAAYYAGNNNPEAAWKDAIAAHRLARAVSTGGTVIERLVGLSCESHAIQADVAILATGKLTAARAKTCLAFLQNLQPLGDMTSPIDTAERFAILDNVMLVARGKGKNLGVIVMNENDKPLHEALNLSPKEIAQVEWDNVLRPANAYFDTLLEAIRKPTFARRLEGLTKAETQISQDRDTFSQNAPAMTLTDRTAAALRLLTFPSFTKSQILYERTLMLADLDQIAFALAAHRAKTGKYPNLLADLSPAYLKTIPLDRFTDQPLHYQPNETGFLLYSVADDQQDNQGNQTPDPKTGARDLAIKIGK